MNQELKISDLNFLAKMNPTQSRFTTAWEMVIKLLNSENPIYIYWRNGAEIEVRTTPK